MSPRHNAPTQRVNRSEGVACFVLSSRDTSTSPQNERHGIATRAGTGGVAAHDRSQHWTTSANTPRPNQRDIRSVSQTLTHDTSHGDDMTIATSADIDYKCGHSDTRDLSAIPAGQRAGRIEWLSGRPCFECFKRTAKKGLSKGLKAERAEFHEDALADQERSGLPPLQGSGKQVSWATDERYKLLKAAYEDLVQSEGMSEPEFEEAILEIARRIAGARWWIDNREATSTELIELLKDPGVELSENPI